MAHKVANIEYILKFIVKLILNLPKKIFRLINIKLRLKTVLQTTCTFFLNSLHAFFTEDVCVILISASTFRYKVV